MRIPILALLASVALCAACAPCDEQTGFPALSGPYLGQTPPGDSAVLFAPGIVSTGLSELNTVFTPDGDEFYYAVDTGLDWVILMTRQMDGAWTEPVVTSFTRGRFGGVDLCISADGERLLYCTNRSRTGGDSPEADFDIWYVERTADGSWSEPANLEAVNSEAHEFYPCLAADGTLYFQSRREGGLGGSDIYRSRLVDGEYAEPENIGAPVNTPGNEGDMFIAPDESYLIFVSRGHQRKPGDGMWISFRGEGDTWSEVRNLGEAMNADRSDFCPMLHPDGKYFFFSSARTRLEDDAGNVTWKSLHDAQSRPANGSTDLYWIDAGFIEELSSASQ